MRIIAGRFGGRVLSAPRGMTTRPMPDRVRQAVFDILGALWSMPGSLPPIDVLDLFSGSGSLGLEAISRGARFCCFVEQDRRALQVLRANIGALQVQSATRIEASDALAEPAIRPGEGPYRLVFVDPPYRLSRDASIDGPIGRLLGRLGEHGGLAEDVQVVLRHERSVSYDKVVYGGLICRRRRLFGRMAVSFLSRAD